MTALTSFMRRDRRGNELALALFDLAVAERVNPPTERDLDAWEEMRVRDEDKRLTLLDHDPFGERKDIFYHGTSGDWAGLPIPAPDDLDAVHQEGWPTAIFVSPYIGHARMLADWKGHKKDLRKTPRIWMGVLDEGRIYQPAEMERMESSDYGGAIRWTNRQLSEWAEDFDHPGGYGAIRPPYYDDYEEDEGQVLVLDPFALRWVDIVLDDDLSVRGVRQLGNHPAYGQIADLDRRAQQAAERLVAQTPTKDLRFRRWRDDRRAVGDVIERTRWPSLSGEVDPYVTLAFNLPSPESHKAGEDWGRFLNQAILDARAAPLSERAAATQRVADIRKYTQWLIGWRKGDDRNFTHPTDADQILTWRLPHPHEFDTMPSVLEEGLTQPLLSLQVEIEMEELRDTARRLNQATPLRFEFNESANTIDGVSIVLQQADRERLAAMSDDRLAAEIAAAQPEIPDGMSASERANFVRGWQDAMSTFLYGLGEDRYSAVDNKIELILSGQGREMLADYGLNLY